MQWQLLQSQTKEPSSCSDMYMEKIAVGPKAAGKISLDDPIEKTIEIVAEANNKKIRDLTVIVQERERHQDIIDRVRAKVHA